MKKKRLKKEVYIFIIILFILLGGFVIYKIYDNYTSSSKYLLLEKGYTVEEVVEILHDKDLTNILLEYEYNKEIIDFVKEKYFIKENLNKYLEYRKLNPKKELSEIVSIINVGADLNWYDTIMESDLTLGNLILVNKFYYLPEDYEIEDLVTMSVKYAFSDKIIKSEVNEAFKNLSSDAARENLTIVANSTYRDYTYQKKLYNNYKNQKGQIYADNYAARAGHSEHQTGLAIDVSTLKSTMEDFEDTKEYKWLIKNAHRYGFILRYPEGKEHLTGYNYESWHYRYVGVDAATQIYNENITFDEYYAYYLR